MTPPSSRSKITLQTIVLLDLGLPRIGGRLVREEMAAHAHTRDIPVVIVTGEASPAAEQLAADCVLTKPVTPETLLEVLRSCLGPGPTP